MNIQVFIKGNVGILKISAHMLGDTDIQNLPSQVKNLLNGGIKKIILDFSAVDLINSMGIGNLMVCLVSVKRAGGEIKLTTLSAKISEILGYMEIDQLFDIHENALNALTSFQNGS